MAIVFVNEAYMKYKKFMKEKENLAIENNKEESAVYLLLLHVTGLKSNELFLKLEDEIEQKIVDEFNKLFDLLHKAQENGLVSSYRGSKGSLQARNIIAEILIDNPNVSEDRLMDWLEEQSDELYEDQEELEDETEEFDL